MLAVIFIYKFFWGLSSRYDTSGRIYLKKKFPFILLTKGINQNEWPTLTAKYKTSAWPGYISRQKSHPVFFLFYFHFQNHPLTHSSVYLCCTLHIYNVIFIFHLPLVLCHFCDSAIYINTPRGLSIGLQYKKNIQCFFQIGWMVWVRDFFFFFLRKYIWNEVGFI